MINILLRLTRSRLSCLAGAIAITTAALGVTTEAAAQDYPDGPVQIIVSYGAGGGTDTLARLLAKPLAEALDQPVPVQNLPGAGGQVAATALLRDALNGEAILATNQPDLYMSVAIHDAPYAIEDFHILMVDLVDPRVMLVQKDSDIQSFSDFVEKAKAEPGEIAVSVSQGSAQELFAKWLFGELGLDVRLVGYNGGSAAANAMVGGEVVATIGDDFARLNIRDQAKALLVAAKGQSPRWPEAETLVAALEPYGITPPAPDFLARYGVYVVPAAFQANNPEAYAKLQAAILEARNGPAFAEYLKSNKIEDLSVAKPGEDFQAGFAASFEAVEGLTE